MALSTLALLPAGSPSQASQDVMSAGVSVPVSAACALSGATCGQRTRPVHLEPSPSHHL